MNTSIQSDLPELLDTYEVPAEKIASCNEKGHVTLRGICSAEEVEAYRQLIAAEVEQRRDTARGGIYQQDLKNRDTRAKAFLQMENLWPDNEGIARFVLSRRLGKIAAQLLGVDAVRIYHDQALFKEPGGGYTPWHQDQFYWPLEDNQTITMWMPLTEMGGEMGTLMFADGTHRDGPLGDIGISDHSEEYFKGLLKQRDGGLSISELDAGDATWHLGWTLHKSPGNTTDKMRQVMTVIFVADGCRITEPANEKQPHDLEKWLPGQQPGELVGSPINPVVWSRG